MQKHRLQWQVVQGTLNLSHEEQPRSQPEAGQLFLAKLIATPQGLLVPIIIDATVAIWVVDICVPWSYLQQVLPARVFAEFYSALTRAQFDVELQQVQLVLAQPDLMAQLYNLAITNFLVTEFTLANIMHVKLYDLSKLLLLTDLEEPSSALELHAQQSVLKVLLQHRKALWLDRKELATDYKKQLKALGDVNQRLEVLLQVMQEVEHQELEIGKLYRAQIVNLDSKLNCAFVELSGLGAQAILREQDISAEFRTQYSKNGSLRKGKKDRAVQEPIANLLNVGQKLTVQLKTHAYDDKLMRVAALSQSQAQDLRDKLDSRDRAGAQLAQLAFALDETTQAQLLGVGHGNWAWYFSNNSEMWGGNSLSQYHLAASKILNYLNCLVQYVQVSQHRQLGLNSDLEQDTPERIMHARAVWRDCYNIRYSATTSRLGTTIDIDSAGFEHKLVVRRLQELLSLSAEKVATQTRQISYAANALELERLVLRWSNAVHKELYEQLLRPNNHKVLLNLCAVLGSLRYVMQAHISGQVIIDLLNLDRNETVVFNNVMQQLQAELEGYAQKGEKLPNGQITDYIAEFLQRVVINVQQGTVPALANNATSKKVFVKNYLTRNNLLEINVERHKLSLKDSLVKLQQNLLKLDSKEDRGSKSRDRFNVITQLQLDNTQRLLQHFETRIEPEIIRAQRSDRVFQGKQFQIWNCCEAMNATLEQENTQYGNSVESAKTPISQGHINNYLNHKLLQEREYQALVKNLFTINVNHLLDGLNRMRLTYYSYQAELGEKINYVHECNSTPNYLTDSRLIQSKQGEITNNLSYRLLEMNQLAIFAE